MTRTRTLAGIIFFLVAGLLLALAYHNTWSFDPFRGFDGAGHAQYITFLRTEKRLPLAFEGWELYQPPLYYLIALLFPSLKAVQFFGFFTYVIFSVLLGYFLIQRFGELVGAVTTLFTASLPVLITLFPAIGNEFLSGVLIGVTLLYAVEYFSPKPTLKHQVCLGILVGLALLTKPTALLLVPALGLHLFFRTNDIGNTARMLVVPIGVAFFLSGWFYLRNWVELGSPVKQSIDYPQFAFTQPPGYRDLRFFVDIVPFFNLDIFKAHWYSLWPGTYFTWFYDGHNLMVPIQEFSKAGSLLTLMTYPAFLASLIGMFRAWKDTRHDFRLLVIFTLLLWFSYILYNLKLPFYSTVKGAFLSSLVVPFAYFFAIGLQKIPQRFQRVLPLSLLVYIVIFYRHFYL